MGEILTVQDIERRIPHRYPMLMVDRVTCLETGKRACGQKQLSMGDPIFQGHFPGNPIFPGVLIVEGLGQLAAILFGEPSADGTVSSEGKFLARIDQARFLRPAVPGETLELEVRVLKELGGFVKIEGEARVGEAQVATAVLTFTLGKQG